MRVFTTAGQSTDTFTLEPVRDSSWYSDSESATTACLLAQYMPSQGRACNPAPEAVFTTWHSSPCAIMMGTNTLTPWMTPHRLTPRTHSQSFTVCFEATVAPFAFISLAVRSRACCSTSASTTFIPSDAKRSAIARPMPLAPPVTTATLPLSSFTPPSSSDSGFLAAPSNRLHGRRYQPARLAILDRHRLPGERFVADQLQDRCSHLRRGDHRDLSQDLLPPATLLRRHGSQTPARERRVHEAGADAIDADI